ncbi:hypothetical protein [Streptomyces brasiliscabiei]|nr:hypothetical protein [Streptomyces brasiliscabiei]
MSTPGGGKATYRPPVGYQDMTMSEPRRPVRTAGFARFFLV